MHCDCKKSACGTRRKRGFTLIELIVVVAVIALLLAITTPTLSQARKRAKTTICLTNQRALTSALRMYIDEWHVGTMYGGHASSYGAWDYQLLGGATSQIDFYTACGRGDATYHVRTCPETTCQSGNGFAVGTATLQWNCGSIGFTNGSYGLNSWLQARLNGATPRGIYRFSHPLPEVSVPAFVDAVSHDLTCVESDPAGADLQAPGGSSEFGSLTSAAINRHRMAVNVSFLDGHADTVKLPDLWTLQWSSRWSKTTPQTIK